MALIKKRTLAATLLLAALALPAQAQAPQPDSTSATYGAWTLTCSFYAADKVQAGAGVTPVKAEGEKSEDKRVRICEVSQSYTQQGAPRSQLAFVPSPQDPKQTLASFRAPVDVFLPFNPSIAADDKEIAKGRFVRCRGRKCMANFAFDQAAIDAFDGAKSASLAYKLSSGKLLNLPISGTGLKRALAAYKEAAK